MREAVLKVNGSNINTWWSLHHYISIGLSTVLCFWKFNSFYQILGKRIFIFSFYTSSIQLIQHFYQIRCLYKMRALGKANIEQTVNSDTPALTFFFSLKVLIPLLIIAHFFQGYLGLYLIVSFFTRNNPTEFCLTCGILFLILCFGNVYTTAKIVLEKHKSKIQKYKIKKVINVARSLEQKFQKSKIPYAHKKLESNTFTTNYIKPKIVEEFIINNNNNNNIQNENKLKKLE
ncbi:transmembrane protein induced by tumor necrosis factor alpha [Anaeramoeba flamelloides]|uniref:Transmembrane protein induced by tumor necrosis factor alpha n=1 Tax=Anaeramoeba flamelloides TaxID=1746091 RepID=A0AAV7Z1P0_9EUKA|nr:transmembrane protein induced by tumor necrosis factor alpha [Anaeramoeba flamelloides]